MDAERIPEDGRKLLPGPVRSCRSPDRLSGIRRAQLFAEELKRLKAFLSEIISRYSDEQLQNLWAGTTAEMGFSEGFRTVLTMIRDHIERHPESRLPGR